MDIKEIYEKMKWDDLYNYWRLSTKEQFYIVNHAPSVRKLRVKSNNQNRIYTCLWLKNNQIEEVQIEMNRMADSPVGRKRKELSDERIMRAADLIVQSKSDEERAAIWIWIFCSSLENAKLPYPNGLYIDYVAGKAREYLQEHFQEWIFRYHHRFPRLFVDSYLLSKVKFERYSVIIDFAIMNAYMLCKEYSIVLFDSEPEKEDPPFSYRDLRKESL